MKKLLALFIVAIFAGCSQEEVKPSWVISKFIYFDYTERGVYHNELIKSWKDTIRYESEEVAKLEVQTFRNQKTTGRLYIATYRKL